MSSKPSESGVRQFREELHKLRERRAEMLEAQAAASRVPRLEEEVNECISRLVKLMESMDVKSNGNMGWEGRVLWFLSELDRQAHAAGVHAQILA